ncbi:MAG: preprotein translocase subunit SecG [Candidatus Brocadiae bacterium]|nr:preprotein translocase subunit SecG [Candidatus Brocadiia bacterium]
MDPEEFRATLKKAAIIGAFFALAVLFSFLGWRTALVAYVATVGALATLAILIQSGRGGGLAASLGGMGGDSLLGARSATPIAKATYVMLGLFLFICMLVARLGPAAEEAPGLLAPEPAAPQAPAPAPPPAADADQVP